MPSYDQSPVKLLRHPSKKIIGGVCAGIAEYTGVNLPAIRLGAVILLVLPTGGVLVYLALWFALPVGTQESPDSKPSILSQLRQRLSQLTD